jgi:hypothetical protein
MKYVVSFTLHQLCTERNTRELMYIYLRKIYRKVKSKSCWTLSVVWDRAKFCINYARMYTHTHQWNERSGRFVTTFGSYSQGPELKYWPGYCCPHRWFSWFSAVLPVKCQGGRTTLTSDTTTCTYFRIHYSLFIPSFDVGYPEVLTASLNEP